MQLEIPGSMPSSFANSWMILCIFHKKNPFKVELVFAICNTLSLVTDSNKFKISNKILQIIYWAKIIFLNNSAKMWSLGYYFILFKLAFHSCFNFSVVLFFDLLTVHLHIYFSSKSSIFSLLFSLFYKKVMIKTKII